MITIFLISKVISSFLYPENVDTGADDFGEKEEVWTTETESNSRLALRLEKSMSSASCASSSSTNTAITKGEKMLVSKVIEKAVKTVQSTEAEKTLQPTMASKILKDNEVVKTLEATEPVKTMKDSDAPSHSYLSSSPIGLV